MANVLVDANSLSAIGNALRHKLGDTKTGYVTEIQDIVAVRYAMSGNVASPTEYFGDYLPEHAISDLVLTIEGASSLELKYHYDLKSGVSSGTHSGIAWTDGLHFMGEEEELSFTNGVWNEEHTSVIAGSSVTVDFGVNADGRQDSGIGFYLEVRGFDANGEYITEPTEVQVPGEVENTFLPAEMADAILSISPATMAWKTATFDNINEAPAYNVYEGYVYEYDLSALGFEFDKSDSWILMFNINHEMDVTNDFGYTYFVSPMLSPFATDTTNVTKFSVLHKGDNGYDSYGFNFVLDYHNAWHEQIGVVPVDSPLTIANDKVRYEIQYSNNWWRMLPTITLYYLDDNKEV